LNGFYQWSISKQQGINDLHLNIPKEVKLHGALMKFHALQSFYPVKDPPVQKEAMR